MGDGDPCTVLWISAASSDDWREKAPSPFCSKEVGGSESTTQDLCPGSGWVLQDDLGAQTEAGDTAEGGRRCPGDSSELCRRGG